MKFIHKVCATCGSGDVVADAYARWDAQTQTWVQAQVFGPKGAVCAKCDGEATIKDVPLTGRRLHAARAYELAMDNGWLPGDEDSPTGYCRTFGLDYKNPIPGEETP